MPTPSAPKPIRSATAIAVIPITVAIYVSSRKGVLSFENTQCASPVSCAWARYTIVNIMKM